MLRFNDNVPVHFLHALHGFKYISCYGLITLLVAALSAIFIQIHLMLRFNLPFQGISRHQSYIQIHLMLRFNDVGQAVRPERAEFKYISCYGLISLRFQIFGFHCIQIHLMLRFNKDRQNKGVHFFIFKYISCYGLIGVSQDCQYLFIYSNTSHVTV